MAKSMTVGKRENEKKRLAKREEKLKKKESKKLSGKTNSFDGNKEALRKTREWVEEKYPNWQRNHYLRTETIVKSISFQLIKNDHISLWTILRKVKRSIRIFIKQ